MLGVQCLALLQPAVFGRGPRGRGLEALAAAVAPLHAQAAPSAGRGHLLRPGAVLAPAAHEALGKGHKAGLLVRLQLLLLLLSLGVL